LRAIEYRGHHAAVDVPLFQLGGVPARTPVEVPDEVAQALTEGGSSELWVDVTPDRSPRRAPAGQSPQEG
jgi:hypothetical protein